MFPLKKVIFHNCVSHYQRVHLRNSPILDSNHRFGEDALQASPIAGMPVIRTSDPRGAKSVETTEIYHGFTMDFYDDFLIISYYYLLLNLG